MEGPLIRDMHVAQAVNKKGLRRAKKEEMEQQDAHLCSYPFGQNAKLALVAVLDGHGGSGCARAGAGGMGRALRRALREEVRGGGGGGVGDMTGVYEKAYSHVDKRLHERGYHYEGTTATTVIIWSSHGGRFLQSANVGDSAAILVRRSGPPLLLSVDHKPSLPLERARLRSLGIDVADSATRLGGLAVSRALGDHFLKRENLGLSAEPHISPVYELGPDDTHLLVASDGLWDVISPSAAADVLRASDQQNAAHLATKLLKQAVSSTKCNDNVTVCVVLL